MSDVQDSQAETITALTALRSGAAYSALDDRALLVARGDDRATFLQGMLSNEVAALAAGEGTRALLLTEQGRVTADLRVYVLDDRVWLDVPASARDDVRSALERFIVADDVELEGEAAIGVAIRGPESPAVLARVAGDGCAALEPSQHCAATIGDGAVRISRVDDLGGVAFHVWGEAKASAALRDALGEAGAVAAGPAAVEVQRITSGEGRLGSEFGLDTLAPEVPSLESAISYRKGCYLGQEVVERVAARGKVNWKVVPLVAGGPVSVGSSVRNANGEVGHVTSAAYHPEEGTTRLLARIRATDADPGTVLQIEGEGGLGEARVTGP